MKIGIMLLTITISLIAYCETKTLKDLKLGDEVITSVTNVIQKRIWSTVKDGILLNHKYEVLESITDIPGMTRSEYILFDIEKNSQVYKIDFGYVMNQIDWYNESGNDELNGVISTCTSTSKNEYGFMLEDSFKTKFKNIELSDESTATIKEIHNVLNSILLNLKN